MPGGVSASTWVNTCESVMMSEGGVIRFCRQFFRLCGVTHRALHPLSNRWRMVCTCGIISRPLGADASCGITNITVSPARVSVPVRSW